MTGSNHCFSNSSDNSRRGENRLTEAVRESIVIDIKKTFEREAKVVGRPTCQPVEQI
jgi:hypothetical protein